MLLLRKSRCVMFVNSAPHDGDKDPDILLPDMSKLLRKYNPSQAGLICPACAQDFSIASFASSAFCFGDVG